MLTTRTGSLKPFTSFSPPHYSALLSNHKVIFFSSAKQYCQPNLHILRAKVKVWELYWHILKTECETSLKHEHLNSHIVFTRYNTSDASGGAHVGAKRTLLQASKLSKHTELPHQSATQTYPNRTMNSQVSESAIRLSSSRTTIASSRHNMPYWTQPNRLKTRSKYSMNILNVTAEATSAKDDTSI